MDKFTLTEEQKQIVAEVAYEKIMDNGGFDGGSDEWYDCSLGDGVFVDANIYMLDDDSINLEIYPTFISDDTGLLVTDTGRYVSASDVLRGHIARYFPDNYGKRGK